jgi:hypothetical protein
MGGYVSKSRLYLRPRKICDRQAQRLELPAPGTYITIYRRSRPIRSGLDGSSRRGEGQELVADVIHDVSADEITVLLDHDVILGIMEPQTAHYTGE